MSRLTKHRQKQIVVYASIFVVLLVFFIFFGLPFFISSSVFISSLFGSKNESTANNPQTFKDLNISDIPEATNSASFVVSGTLNNFDVLEFYLNDQKVKSEDVKDKDSFLEEIPGLQPGENKFYLVGKTEKSSEKKQTSTYLILYKNSKPKLEISEPSDNLKTNHTEIKVVGSTDKDTEVKINGIPVVIDPNGNFQTQVKLNSGDNKIIITVRDLVGNQEEKTLTVNYSPDN